METANPSFNTFFILGIFIFVRRFLLGLVFDIFIAKLSMAMALAQKMFFFSRCKEKYICRTFEDQPVLFVGQTGLYIVHHHGGHIPIDFFLKKILLCGIIWASYF